MLAFAATAQAKDVVNTFGSNGVGAGQFSFTVNEGATVVPTNTIGGVAVNSSGVGVGVSAGDVYAVDPGNNRIEQFSSTGQFIRAWGYDVVRSGQDNTGANEQQTVTVPGTVTAGSFTLTVTTAVGEGTIQGRGGGSLMADVTKLSTSFGAFHVGDRFIVSTGAVGDAPTVSAVGSGTLTITNIGALGSEFGQHQVKRLVYPGQETTTAIPYNAPATGPGSVQSALEQLPGVGPGAVSVSGGPGGSAPFTITFGSGPFAGNNVPQVTVNSSLTGGTATSATTVEGGGLEVCRAASSPADVCTAGSPSSIAGGLSTPQGVAVDQATGNLYVTDQGNRRVDVFGSDGTFQGAFGRKTKVTGAAEELQFCTSATGCQAGTSGANAGQFAGALGYPAVAPSGAPDAGNVIVADSANNRVDEFAPTLSSGVVTGVSFVRGIGWATKVTGSANELQACTVATGCKAGAAGGGAGQFSSEGVVRVAVDSTGAIYALNLPTATTCSASARCAVQKINAAATSAADFAPADLTRTSGNKFEVAATALTVDPATGALYAVRGSEFPPEVRMLSFDSAGSLQSTSLANFSVDWLGPLLAGFRGNAVMPATGFAFDQGSGRLLLASSFEEEQHIFVFGNIPASAEETISAAMDQAPVTDIDTEHATVHGVATAAQGIFGPTYYQFEHTNGTSWVKGPLVNIGDGSGSGSPGSCPVENPPSCNVSEELELESGQTYRVRLHVFVPFNSTLSATSPAVRFKAIGVVPNAETGNAWWSSPPETNPNLMLTGFINPRDEATTFYFQYASAAQFAESGYEGSQTAPLPPGDPAAHSFNTVEVQQPIYELDPNTTYHYRLIAVSPSGTAYGSDRTIVPASPDQRFAELVSNGNGGGNGSLPVVAVSDQGSRIYFEQQTFGDPLSAPGVYSLEVSDRTDSGWKVTTLAPEPLVGYPGLGLRPRTESLVSSDLSEAILASESRRESASGTKTFQLAALAGTSRAVSPVLTPLSIELNKKPEYQLVGGSGNLSRYVFTTLAGGVTFAPGEFLVPKPNAYVINSNTLEVSLLNVNTAGEEVGGVCGATLGGASYKRNAISLDGAEMYFSARVGAPNTGTCSTGVENEFPTRIFMRQNGATTTEVSQSQCVRVSPPCAGASGGDTYRAASADGSTVAFSSSRQLTNSDLDSGEDLYIYDSSPPEGQPKLVQATAGEVTAGHPVVGSGGEFVGVVGVSSDGSRVYFVAKGQLTSGASAGQNNLYVFERDSAHPGGRIGFIGDLSSSDASLWSAAAGREVQLQPTAERGSDGTVVYGDGHFLFFTSTAKLLLEDTDSVADLYRFDDASNQLVCLSCVGQGEFPVSIAMGSVERLSLPSGSETGRMASSDGSDAVFQTNESLVPADEDGVTDVYEWRNGVVSLVSGNTGELGILDLRSSELGPTMSPDGRDVYFTTEARLVPSSLDTDTAPDVYDARLGGGFPQAKPEARICIDGEVCRGPTTQAPAIPQSDSATFSGPGNPGVVKPRARRCRKGTIRRHGHCVKRHRHTRHRKSQRHTGGGK